MKKYLALLISLLIFSCIPPEKKKVYEIVIVDKFEETIDHGIGGKTTYYTIVYKSRLVMEDSTKVSSSEWKERTEDVELRNYRRINVGDSYNDDHYWLDEQYFTKNKK
jgi:hypothetical protein